MASGRQGLIRWWWWRQGRSVGDHVSVWLSVVLLLFVAHNAAAGDAMMRPTTVATYGGQSRNNSRGGFVYTQRNNHANISELLDNLLRGYDNSVRPEFGGKVRPRSA